MSGRRPGMAAEARRKGACGCAAPGRRRSDDLRTLGREDGAEVARRAGPGASLTAPGQSPAARRRSVSAMTRFATTSPPVSPTTPGQPAPSQKKPPRVPITLEP